MQSIAGDAAVEYKYLLDKGYPRTSALRFVGDHHRLGKRERNRLVRGVFSAREDEEHRERMTGIEEIMGSDVFVDGFNVLATAEAVLFRPDLVVAASDGFLRDVRGDFGRYRWTRQARQTAEKLLTFLSTHEPDSVSFLFDRQVSRSGEIAAWMRGEMEAMGLAGEGRTDPAVDRTLKQAGGIVATSDSAVIERCAKVVDLPCALQLKYRETHNVTRSPMGDD